MASFILSRHARQMAEKRSTSVESLFPYTCQIRYTPGSGLRRRSIAEHLSHFLSGQYVIYDLGYVGPGGEYVDEYRFAIEADAVGMRVCYSGLILTGASNDSLLSIEMGSDVNQRDVYFIFRDGVEDKT